MKFQVRILSGTWWLSYPSMETTKVGNGMRNDNSFLLLIKISASSTLKLQLKSALRTRAAPEILLAFSLQVVEQTKTQINYVKNISEFKYS